jgi:hypothetical protein
MDLDWICLVEAVDLNWALVYVIPNVQVSYRAGNFLTNGPNLVSRRAV